MPKVFLNEQDRASHRLASWVQGEMKIRRISQSAMADERGITQQALSNKFREESFSFKDFFCFVQNLGPDDEALHYILGIKGG